MIRTTATACFLALATLSATAQSPQFTGNWIVTADLFSTPIYARFTLDQKGDKLTGNFNGDKLEGTVTGNSIHFVSKDDEGGSDTVQGTLQNGILTGDYTEIDGSNPSRPEHHTFTAVLAAPLQRTSQRHDFTPTVFYRQFSPFYKPVLTVNPGDTIHTTTVDAGGTDEQGVRRVLGGNPETGPFYIQGAQPGDTLVVHLVHLKLNRDYAISDDNLVGRALGPNLAVKMKDTGKTIRWHLDLAKGLASPEKPGEHMRSFTIPVHPMLGCIATATGPANAPPGSGDSGGFGGNMDFNENAEGATIYLPVSNPGALLYVGDGHALQGDGELNGNALETSMDVEFTVDVLPGKRIGGRRVETPTDLIAMGLAGSLDDAIKEATSNMASWLEQDYKLTPTEIAQFLGVASEYHISEVADRNAGIVLKIAKSKLSTLTPAAK
ncbi:MAG TPA: acetamidase/formamidase family protein [Edaphobacter sp.]|jgi:amidase|nr:acetamidase/formamidase family protein [Edaphobacter sp.]